MAGSETLNPVGKKQSPQQTRGQQSPLDELDELELGELELGELELELELDELELAELELGELELELELDPPQQQRRLVIDSPR